jgi:hypothetical protein
MAAEGSSMAVTIIAHTESGKVRFSFRYWPAVTAMLMAIGVDAISKPE